jgi:hypothetical protein
MRAVAVATTNSSIVFTIFPINGELVLEYAWFYGRVYGLELVTRAGKRSSCLELDGLGPWSPTRARTTVTTDFAATLKLYLTLSIGIRNQTLFSYKESLASRL